MAFFIDVWAPLAGQIGSFLGCYDMQRQFASDAALVTQCLRDVDTLRKVQVCHEWMVAIRDAQAASDIRCQALVLPAFVLFDIVRHADRLPLCKLDTHPAVVGPNVFISLLLCHSRDLRDQQHQSYIQWQQGADLLLLDRAMKRIFDQSLVFLTVCFVRR